VIIKNLPFYLGDAEEKVKSKIKRVFKVFFFFFMTLERKVE